MKVKEGSKCQCISMSHSADSKGANEGSDQGSQNVGTEGSQNVGHQSSERW